MSELETLLSKRKVLICCGAGGVGKTTTAAALGLAGALSGKRACVVTIDPARRLADALDIETSTDEVHQIEGAFSGELYALMLDAKATFDRLVELNAKSPEQAERIQSNRLYRNLVSALAGTQEYMATEKLYELYQSDRFDLIIIDTPPTRFAFDFLDAPNRLVGFLNNKVFRLLVTPGRAYLKALSFASQLLLKTIAKVAGSEIVEDTIAFFQAFDGMEQGFKDRAAKVETLLDNGETGFVLVCAPRTEAIEQSRQFATRLKDDGRAIDVLIVNRAVPNFGSQLEVEHWKEDSSDPELANLMANLSELSTEAARERALLRGFHDELIDTPMLVVPLLAEDVHDLSSLQLVVDHLGTPG